MLFFPALSVCFSLGYGCWTEHPIIKACLTEGSFQLCSHAFGGRNSAILMQRAVGMTCPDSLWFHLLVLLCSLGSPLSLICLIARGLGGKMLAGQGKRQPDLLILQCASFALSAVSERPMLQSDFKLCGKQTPQLQCSVCKGVSGRKMPLMSDIVFRVLT